MSLLYRCAAVLATVVVLLGSGGLPVGRANPPAGSDGYYQPYSNDFSGMEEAWTADARSDTARPVEVTRPSSLSPDSITLIRRGCSAHRPDSPRSLDTRSPP